MVVSMELMETGESTRSPSASRAVPDEHQASVRASGDTTQAALHIPDTQPSSWCTSTSATDTACAACVNTMCFSDLRCSSSVKTRYLIDRIVRTSLLVWMACVLIYAYIAFATNSGLRSDMEILNPVPSVVRSSCFALIIVLVLHGLFGDLAASMNGRRRRRVCGTAVCIVGALGAPVVLVYLGLSFTALQPSSFIIAVAWWPMSRISLDFIGWSTPPHLRRLCLNSLASKPPLRWLAEGQRFGPFACEQSSARACSP
jgi:hypothetical protein